MDATLIYGGWFFLFMDGALPLIMLLGHLTRRVRPLPLYLFVGTLFMPIYQALSLIPLEVVSWKSHLAEIIIYTSGYGVALYTILCEWLMRRGAKQLTEKRGENWPKEIDYLYLTIGAFGIFATITRSDASLEHAWAPGTLSGILLTTALVLRFIKTRAEVKGWNKKDAVVDPQGDAVVQEEEEQWAALKNEKT